MSKNAGKTTVLNYILEHYQGTIGITSVGRDGESLDSVYKVSKPRIFVLEGTIVASTTEALENSSIEYEVLKNTGIITPMGEVQIIRVSNEGYVDVAGPSYAEQIKEVYQEVYDLVDLFIIDGAFSRKQIAASNIVEASILVTGAAF